MRILVVEDDPQLRTSVARGLREASYQVDEAADGDEALRKARSGAYDAIVLDILLPETDGIEVCRVLREESDWSPVLMLTALDAVEDRIRGLDAGADDYLPKPFDFGELLARLRALTRRRSDDGAPEIRVGDLLVDIRRRSVRRGSREIELTPREFEFLVYLARHAGEVVSRAELVTHVWGETATHSNVIDVYASRLRRKVDTDGEPALFRTHRGVGYRLDVAPGDE